MSVQPLVSVIIPAYNAAATVGRTLESVLSQSWTNLQVIVVNDGSTDGTGDVLARFASRDPRVTVLSQANAGVSAARNLALDIAAGRYIRFVDADDTLPPASIEHMVIRAERDGADLVLGGYREYMKRLSRSMNLENRGDTIPFQSLLSTLCAHANSYFYGVLWNKLYSAELIRKSSLRFDPVLWWGEDFAFNMDYLREVSRVAFMKEDLYDYRRSPRSATFRQVLDCVVHPLGNIRIKRVLYSHLKGLYIARGAYPEYRGRLWHYLFRVGLN